MNRFDGRAEPLRSECRTVACENNSQGPEHRRTRTSDLQTGVCFLLFRQEQELPCSGNVPEYFFVERNVGMRDVFQDRLQRRLLFARRNDDLLACCQRG